MNKKVLIFAMGFIASSQIYADFKGSIIEVLDGGRVVVHSNTKDVVVKLNSIATPFPNQSLYSQSRQVAEHILLGRDVTVITNENTSQNCINGELISNGINLNESLLYTGFAWLHNKESAPVRYLDIERQNEVAQKGLFKPESRFQFNSVPLVGQHMVDNCMVVTNRTPIDAQYLFVAERDKYGFGYSIRAIVIGVFLGLVALIGLFWIDNLGLNLGLSKHFKPKKKKGDDSDGFS
ncbi:hypothetical protein HLH17_14420 [Acinetobacter sp. ANC 5380]|uniref:TNase-like domain-containing protein n=1 Tax=Acinetobacter terrae TaxID=2731247 RepID=A0A7Y2WBV1_9GAMM|nr:hypothetical protein [Acinetobacter terrae]NNH78816.1 hypothetical protein [Acinetobacter terrae]